MKKTLLCMGILALLLTAASGAFAAGTINLVVNDKKIAVDSPPVIINDRVLVPIRAVCEALDAQVTWCPESGTVDVRYSQGGNLPLLKLEGERTTWPYWYENGDLYMEQRNIVELLRIKYPPPWNNICFSALSQEIIIRDKAYAVVTAEKDGFTVVSLNSLRKRQALDFTFTPATGDLILK